MKLIALFLALFFSIKSIAASSGSRTNRADQYVTVVASPLGWGPNYGLNSGVLVGIYFGSMTQLEFQYKAASMWYNAGTYEYMTTTGSSYGASIKQFLGNSFYFRLGGGVKKASFIYETQDSYATSRVEQGRAEGRATYASFSIGNQWSFKSFTIGCDWLGWSKIMDWKLSEVIQPSATSSHISTIKRHEDYFFKDDTPIVTNFYLGYAF